MSKPRATARKPRESAKGHSTVAAVLRYAAFHETNLAMCLAAGFFGPRHERNVAADHHQQAGKIILSEGPPTAAQLDRAKGGLPYGAVAVVEFDLSTLSLDPSGSPEDALPLSCARKIIFGCSDDSKAFQAKASGFGDVPVGAVDFAVDASFFEPDEKRDLLEGFSGDASHDLPTVDLVARPAVVPRDKLAGAVAAMFRAARETQDPTLLEAWAAEFQNVRNTDGSGLFLQLATSLDIDPSFRKYQSLLMHAVRVLITSDPGAAFSAAGFLRELEGSFDSIPDSRPPEVAKFLKFSSEIVSLKRDLPTSAFSDLPGSTIPRALLLLLLNPDPDRIMAVRKRTPDIGPRVFCLAGGLIGLRSGMTRLPVNVKADKLDAFLALSSFVFELFMGRNQTLAYSRQWKADGASNAMLMNGRSALIKLALPNTQQGAALCRSLMDAGLAPRYEKDGRIAAESGPTRFEFSSSPSPTFPRTDVLLILATQPSAMSKKTMGQRVEASRHTALETGVFAELEVSGRKRAYLAKAFVHPDNSEGIKAALAALERCLDSLSKETSGATEDLAGATSPALL